MLNKYVAIYTERDTNTEKILVFECYGDPWSYFWNNLPSLDYHSVSIYSMIEVKVKH